MRYYFRLVDCAAPGQGLLQVNVTQGETPTPGVLLQLHSSPWVTPHASPEEAVTGTKDADHPGLVEFVHVEPRNRMIGIEVQTEQFVLILLDIPVHGIWRLDVDLTAPLAEHDLSSGS